MAPPINDAKPYIHYTTITPWLLHMWSCRIYIINTRDQYRAVYLCKLGALRFVLDGISRVLNGNWRDLGLPGVFWLVAHIPERVGESGTFICSIILLNHGSMCSTATRPEDLD